MFARAKKMKSPPGVKRGLDETGRGGSPDSLPPDLSWVDDFIANVRPYIFVRREDGVLIKMPNQAHHLNDTGVRVMEFLLGGGTIKALLEQAGYERADDIIAFICQVKRCLEGRLRETDISPAVTVKPLAVNFSRLPVLAEIALTNRCNLRCIFCYAGCSCSTARGDGEMTTAEVMAVIDKIIADAKVPSVSFTGGEPSLRPDLPELVAHAAGNGMRVNLITNGTMITRALAGELAQAGLSSAQVSLEGVTDAVHDAVTGIPGSFDRTLEGLSRLSRAGLYVHTNTTINRLNIATSDEFPLFVRGLGLDKFSMNLIIPSGSASINRQHLVRYLELDAALKRVIAASEAAGIEFMWYSPTPVCLFNPIIHGLGNKGCSACDGLLSVDSSGNVLPCSSWNDPVGNLLREDFRELWFSERASSLRFKSEAHPHCRYCDSFAVCHGACPLYWRHFGFEELGRNQGFAPESELGYREAVTS